MKKFYILGILICCLFFVNGCSSSQQSIVTQLANQIDLLNNTITSVSEINTSIPSVNELSWEIDSSHYDNIYQISMKKFDSHESMKAGISGKSNLIKNTIASQDLKIEKKSLSALADLSKTLGKQTKKLNETKSEYFYSVKNVKKAFEQKEATNAQISAKLNDFTDCIESRTCFYINILSTLSQVEDILNIQDNSFSLSEYEDANKNKYDESYEDDLKELYYRNMLNDKLQTGKSGEDKANLDTFVNEESNENNNVLQKDDSNDFENESNISINNQNINPKGRNSDTYRPSYTNIDSYRPYGYGNFGYNGNYGYARGFNNNTFGGNGYSKATGFSNNRIQQSAIPCFSQVTLENYYNKETKETKEAYLMDYSCTFDVNDSIRDLIE